MSMRRKARIVEIESKFVSLSTKVEKLKHKADRNRAIFKG